MRLVGNDITIHRGETFSFDRKITNKDGTPYIISSKYNNPYFLLTVSSSRYDQDKRYVYNYWLDLKNVKRFINTTPITGYTTTTCVKYLENNEPNTNNWDKYAFVDILNKVFYYDNGTIHYYNAPRFVHTFLSSVTSNWVEQTYNYSITLVDGPSTNDYINTTYEMLVGKDTTVTMERYNILKENFSNLVENINLNYPITKFDVKYPIITPSKLIVLSDLEEVRHGI